MNADEKKIEITFTLANYNKSVAGRKMHKKYIAIF